jgi:hypothetical protein
MTRFKLTKRANCSSACIYCERKFIVTLFVCDALVMTGNSTPLCHVRALSNKSSASEGLWGRLVRRGEERSKYKRGRRTWVGVIRFAEKVLADLVIEETAKSERDAAGGAEEGSQVWFRCWTGGGGHIQHSLPVGYDQSGWSPAGGVTNIYLGVAVKSTYAGSQRIPGSG